MKEQTTFGQLEIGEKFVIPGFRIELQKVNDTHYWAPNSDSDTLIYCSSSVVVYKTDT